MNILGKVLGAVTGMKEPKEEKQRGMFGGGGGIGRRGGNPLHYGTHKEGKSVPHKGKSKK